MFIRIIIIIFFSFTQAEFEYMRDQIVQLFPTETPDVLYVAHQESTQFNDSTQACGKLSAHAKYVRSRLKKAGFITDKSAKKTSSTFSASSDSNLQSMLAHIWQHFNIL